MANKGLPIGWDALRRIWNIAYVPLTSGKYTVVSLAGEIRGQVGTLRLVYSEDMATIVTVMEPTVITWGMWDYMKEQDWEAVVRNLPSSAAFIVPGPIKPFIVKVSRKQGYVRLVGTGGEIKIWQKAHTKKRGQYIGNEWGIEFRMADRFFSTPAQQGKVLRLERLLDAYDKIAEMLTALK